MKKSTNNRFISMKENENVENRPISDPDENLYNDPFDDEISTLKSKYLPKVKGKTFSKNDKKVSFSKKNEENALE